MRFGGEYQEFAPVRSIAGRNSLSKPPVCPGQLNLIAFQAFVIKPPELEFERLRNNSLPVGP